MLWFAIWTHTAQDLTTLWLTRPEGQVNEKPFSHKSFLKTHQRSHTEEELLNCSFCKKSFSESGHVKTHTIIHKVKNVFECSNCDKSFIHFGSIKIHQKSQTEKKLVNQRNTKGVITERKEKIIYFVIFDISCWGLKFILCFQSICPFGQCFL